MVFQHLQDGDLIITGPLAGRTLLGERAGDMQHPTSAI